MGVFSAVVDPSVARRTERAYYLGMARPIEDARVLQVIHRQSQDSEEHDLGLIEECLRLTPEQRLQRLAAWVNLVSSARPVAPLSL